MNGSILMNGPRRLQHLKNTGTSGDHSYVSTQTTQTPPGVSAHWDVIPDNLLVCYQDIVNLEAAVADKRRPSQSVDDIQASIESRLADLVDLCEGSNMAAECARLAAHICCYTAYVEVWKNFLIPCPCALLLLDAPESSFDDKVWIKRRDLQLWLILVGSCTARLDYGHLKELKSGFDALVTRILTTVAAWPQAKVRLQSALEGFAYTQTWFQHLHGNQEWVRLVDYIGGIAAVHQKIGNR